MAVLLSIGGSIAVALLARWKHFTEADAKIYRGMGQHNLMPQALGLMFPKKSVVAAENAERAALLAGREVEPATKKTVRGGKVSEFIAKPTTAKHVLPVLSQVGKHNRDT